jgi:hypothetical protein
MPVMESALFILTCISLALACLAIALWMALLVYRVIDNRRRRQTEQIHERWLMLLLPVLEGEAELKTLPVLRGRLETEAVLGLLRNLAERFRGQYRDGLHSVLRHIGAEEYGLRLTRRRSVASKLRGCALLAWTGPNHAVDERLVATLRHPRPKVRLEAANALAARQAPGITLQGIVIALKATGALRSDRARDIIRLLAPAHHAELLPLLYSATEPREKVLLLEGIGMAGDLSHAGSVAAFLADTSPKVRATAVAALELLADPLHIKEVAQRGADPDPCVRRAVARYAASMNGEGSSLAILKELAMDREFDVRRTAVHALAASGGPAWEELGRLSQHDALLESLMREASQPSAKLLLPTVVRP